MFKEKDHFFGGGADGVNWPRRGASAVAGLWRRKMHKGQGRWRADGQAGYWRFVSPATFRQNAGVSALNCAKAWLNPFDGQTAVRQQKVALGKIALPDMAGRATIHYDYGDTKR
jgi:hypothetical protein